MQGQQFEVQLGGLPELSATTSSGAPPTLKGASLSCGPGLAVLLRGSEQVVRARLAQSTSVDQFLVELVDIVRQMFRRRPPAKLPPPAYYERIVAEMDAVGWHRLESLDSSMTRLALRCLDPAGRAHSLVRWACDVHTWKPKESTTQPRKVIR